MGWLTKDDREYLNPMIDKYLDACEQRQRAEWKMKELEGELARVLAGYELDEVYRQGWAITVILPEDGDVRLEVSRLRIANLND